MSSAPLTNTDLLAVVAPNVTLPLDADGKISPVTEGKQHFVISVETDVERDVGCELAATATLYREGIMIHIWAFNVPLRANDPQLDALAAALGMEWTDEHIPDPERDGWEITTLGERHDFATVYETYVGRVADAAGATSGPTEGNEGEAGVASEASAVVAGAGDQMAPQLYGDAVCITPYNEADYGNEIVITIGGNRQSKQWSPKAMPAGAFIASLCRHKEGQKDGTAFVLGDMVAGRRLKTSVKALYGVGLDIDTGTPTITIDNALKKLGRLAVRYSTHSSGKTKTDIKKDKVMKFAGDREIDQELIRYFLQEVEQWDAGLVDNADYIGTEHTEQGIVCQITHPPMPKHRIVLLFKEPFEIGKEGQTQAEAMKKWAKVPEALARLLNVPFDTSCTDPSRLFYLPRHAKGKPFSISLFGGSYFDWRALELDDPMEKLNAAISKGKSKSVTHEGRELGRWSLKRAHGFQIKDVIDAYAPDKIRHNTGRGYETECPFDEDHTNSGDQEDRACLVVNAGEGPGEFFTISCRHESCRDKTFLDMLGKMLKDGWFEEGVLEDEQFNAILEEDEKPGVAKKIETEDEARAEYDAAIAALTPSFKQTELNAAVALVIKANLPKASLAKAQAAIKEAADIPITAVRATFNEVTRKERKEPRRSVLKSPKGQSIFSYFDEFNFDEGCDAVKKAVLAENERRALPILCTMDGVMVRLETNAGGEIEFAPLSHYDFWAYVVSLLLFVRTTDAGDGSRDKVPEDVARYCYSECRSWLPEAPEVVRAPLFLSGGRLLITPKYWYSPDEGMNHLLRLDRLPGPVLVPDHPTEQEARLAAEYLRIELLGDFPFLDTNSDGVESRAPAEANALAMLLTPFMRNMIEGRTPLFFIMKPDPGTGATLLASMPQLIFDGVLPENTRYTSNDEEMSKTLIAAVQKPRSHLFFDNVREFNSLELIRTITSPFVSGRLLGANKTIARPNNFNWIATAISPVVKAEMDRRTCWIRMNSEGLSSDERSFRHKALDQYVLANRHTIIGHLLTMIQYWIDDGEKPFTDRRRASFEDWSAKVGGVLKVCGIEGFLDTKRFTGQDRERTAWTQLASRWFKRHAVGSSSKVTEVQLYDLAIDPPLALIHGFNEEARRANFMGELPRMVGMTFELGETSESKVPYKVKCEEQDGGEVEYWFEPVVRGESK